MAVFSPEFIALAQDPAGEVLRVRLHVRLNDNGGQPGTLFSLTEEQTVLALPEIVRQREKKFGVIQGQAWQIQVTNRDLALFGVDLVGCWACIEGGFFEADEWADFAQGKIRRVIATTEGVVTLEIHDAVMDVLNFKLPRDIRFQNTGWVSEVSLEKQSAESSGWDADVGLEVPTPSILADETFVIQFHNDTEYEVLNEDGDVVGVGDVGMDVQVENASGNPSAIIIPREGWVQDPGSYAAGDRFVFNTAYPRSPDKLTAVNIVRHLVEDLACLKTFDVKAGAEHSSPLYDLPEWTLQGAEALTDTVAGFFRKGTALSALIQDALKVVHGTIHPSPTGQIALFVLQSAPDGGLILNGDPTAGKVHILGMSFTDDLGDTVSDVTFEYLTLASGEEASITAEVENSPLLSPVSETVSIGWEVRDLSIENAANQYRERFGGPRRTFNLETTLAGAVADLSGAIAINEPTLGLYSVLSSVSEVAVNLLENKVRIVAFSDPFVTQDFAKVGTATVDGPEVIW